MNAGARSLLIHFLFFLSGAAALIYQVAWERLLGLWSGSDVLSASLVVSAFLAGLGLGSMAGGVVADRRGPRACVAWFAACNLAIAGFALLSPALLYDLLYQKLAFLAGSRALVFGVSFAILLVPTLLMGSSLPFLSRALVGGLEGASRTISRLNAVDILGAACGSFATSWLLLGSVGVVGAIRVGAFLSVAVGLLGWAVADRSPRIAPVATPAPGTASAPPPAPSVPGTGSVALWCALFLLSGFLAIALEIVWIRYFGVVTTSSAYTFGHVLGVFLLFDALGLLLGARVVRRVREPRRLFLPLQGAIVGAAAAALLTLGHATIAPLGQFVLTDRSPFTYGLVFGLLPAWAIGPAATLVGFSFPLVQAALQTDSAAVGRRVGLAQLSNIVGNALGGLLTGVVLLEFLGTLGTLRLLTSLGLLGALLAVAGPVSWRLGGRARMAAVLLCALLAGVLVAIPAPEAFWPTVMNFGREGARFAVGEDATGISVLREDAENAVMWANGNYQGEIPFRYIHFRLGITGPLLHPDPRAIYIVGVGSGATASGAGVLPETASVRAIELVESSLHLLEAYARGPRGGPVLSLFTDPRFVLVVGDGRRELAQRPDRFDVIEADAVEIQCARSGMIYSLEFFSLVRRRLREGGMMVQWAATDRVRATFRQAFPYGLETHSILVGSDRPIVVDRALLEKRLRDSRVAARVALGGEEPENLLVQLGAPRATWSPLTPRETDPEALLTDLFPRDEFYLRPSFRSSRASPSRSSAADGGR